MGKCLSCCKQPDAANNHPHKDKKNGDGIVKTELSSFGGAVGSAGATTSSSSSSSGGRRRPSVESSSANIGSAGSHSDHRHHHHHHHPMNSEKQQRTFYQRIPPIGHGHGGGGAGGGGGGGGAGGTIEASSKRLSSSSRECSETKIVALYEQYRDSNEDAILSEGIEHLCRDLDVRPEEFRVLLLAWKFDAETMCRFSRQEFVSGCKCLKVSSIRGIQSRFVDMLLEVQTNTEKFKDLYRFTFKFGLDSEIGQRILPVDMAIGLWRLVFSQNEPPILERWLEFLEKHPSVRGIPRDTWNMFLNFLDAVGDDLSTYNDAEAWPSIFDDFVEYENDQTNQNVTPGRDVKMVGDDHELHDRDF